MKKVTDILFTPLRSRRNQGNIVKNDEGVSELLDETLILGLVIVCAAIVGVMVMGFAIPVEKTAYVVPQFNIKDVSGKSVITVFDRGGDPLYFTASGLANYKAAFYVDTSAGSFQAVPDAALLVFRPGDTIYLYYTGTGFIATNDLSGASFVTLPVGKIAVRLVDINSGVLIAGDTIVEGTSGTATVSPTTAVTTATPAPTATVTANVTATPTVNITTTITTATPAPTVTTSATPTATETTAVPTVTSTPTPTATTPSGSFGVTVSWSPPGLGSATFLPSTPVSNGQAVSVTAGTSPSFRFTPNSNKAVLTVYLDGSQVYTGSAKGTPVTVTVPSVSSTHTLTATFG